MAISVLDDALINQIAAGEVVERPASVVKELVDNAIDAGATHVEVALRQGGRELIRVVDNGCGMSEEDAVMCLRRHATSKITSAEDLYAVQTLGFRGEAIPSIASVSRMEIITRPNTSKTGTRVKVEGGIVLDVSCAGAALGTEFNIRNLFFNVPVRRKFLRTPTTESGHCVDVVTRAAMANPDIGFKLEMDGRTILRCVKTSTLAERIRQLTKENSANLWEVQFEEAPIRCKGFISAPSVHRGSARNSLFVTVNGRPIRDNIVRRAISHAYRNLVPKGRIPVAVLDIELPSDMVDVNVHPAKVEVRFRDPAGLLRGLNRGLEQTLAAHGITMHAPPARPISIHQAIPAHPADDPTVDSAQGFMPLPLSAPAEFEGLPKENPPAAQPGHLCMHLQTPFTRFSSLRVLGQVARSFLVGEWSDSLFVLRLDSALTWLSLHDMRMGRGTGAPHTRPLEGAVPLTVRPSTWDRLMAREQALEEIGLTFAQLSATSVMIRTVPRSVWEIRQATLMQEIEEILKQKALEQFSERVESALAKHSLPDEMPGLSAYDMRAMMASLDEVNVHVGWSVSPLWGSLNLSNAIHPIEP